MLRATEVIAKGDWNTMPVECVVLSFEQRHHNVISLMTVSGKPVKLDLVEPVALRSGDALLLEGGDFVEIIGQPEPLAEVRVETPEALAQIAWHLGNRHFQCQISAGRIRIRRDPMLESVVKALGGTLRFVEAAFDPEGAAYAHAKRRESDHVHDANCGCGHDHHQHAHGAHDHAHHDHGHSVHASKTQDDGGHAHEHHDGCCGGHHHGHKHE